MEHGAGVKAVVVAPLFLQPGKHAGAGGDLACILEAAAAAAAADGCGSSLPQVVMASLVAPHPQLTELLAARYNQAVPVSVAAAHAH